MMTTGMTSRFHSHRPRVFYFTHRVPFPPDKGDRIRTYHLLLQLAEKANVWLLALADEPVTPAVTARLAGLCEQLAIVPVKSGLRWWRAAASLLLGNSLSEGLFHEPLAERILTRWLADTHFSAFLASSSAVAPLLLRHRSKLSPGGAIVIDMIDVDSQKWLDYATKTWGPLRFLYRLEGQRVRQLERRIAREADTIAVVSHAEARIIDEFAGPGRTTVAENGVDLDYFQPYPATIHSIEQPLVAFVGAMDYWPNVDAVTWFVENVWRDVRSRYPETRFRIIGRNPIRVIRSLHARDGIEVTGAVPDVRPEIAPAAIVVAPLRIARGVQNKVLEAMALGKAVVASPPALNALSVTPGREVLRAESASDWLNAICHLLDSPSRRRELGDTARAYVERHHHWNECLAPLVNAGIPQEKQELLLK